MRDSRWSSASSIDAPLHWKAAQEMLREPDMLYTPLAVFDIRVFVRGVVGDRARNRLLEAIHQDMEDVKKQCEATQPSRKLSTNSVAHSFFQAHLRILCARELLSW